MRFRRSGRRACGRCGSAASLAAFLFFFTLYGVPNVLGKGADLQTLRGLQVDYIAILAGFYAVCIVVARRWTGRAGWGPPQVLALLTGGMVPSLLISLGFVAAAPAADHRAVLSLAGVAGMAGEAAARSDCCH